MHERSAEDCSAGERRRDPRDYFQFHIRIFFCQFQDRSRHSVDSCVPAADHHDRSSFFRLRKSHLAALDLPFHGGRQKFLIWKVRLREIHIDRVSHDHIAGVKRLYGTERHGFIFSRSHADHCQLLHMSVPFLNSVEKSGA